MSKQTDISKAAAEYDPPEIKGEVMGVTCFKAGAKYALECPEVTAMRDALAHADRYIDYAMEFGDTSKNTVGIECVKEALAAFDALKKGE